MLFSQTLLAMWTVTIAKCVRGSGREVSVSDKPLNETRLLKEVMWPAGSVARCSVPGLPSRGVCGLVLSSGAAALVRENQAHSPSWPGTYTHRRRSHLSGLPVSRVECAPWAGAAWHGVALGRGVCASAVAAAHPCMMATCPCVTCTRVRTCVHMSLGTCYTCVRASAHSFVWTSFLSVCLALE